MGINLVFKTTNRIDRFISNSKLFSNITNNKFNECGTFKLNCNDCGGIFL